MYASISPVVHIVNIGSASTESVANITVCITDTSSHKYKEECTSRFLDTYPSPCNTTIMNNDKGMQVHRHHLYFRIYGMVCIILLYIGTYYLEFASE